MLEFLRRLFGRTTSRTSATPFSGLEDLPTRTFVVDDRVFLLGLDYLYRERMQEFEAQELLPCARAVARALGVSALAGPVEGYYAERADLTEYFHLMRAVQDLPRERERDVRRMKEFRRLLEVTSSPMFGRVVREKLLPVGRDPLSQALLDTMSDWSVERLLDAAHHAALEWDDYSLVGLAARIRDPVVVAALRESVVLYAEVITLGLPAYRSVFEWRVGPELVTQARRFIREFHRFVPGGIPDPSAENAARYYDASEKNEVGGRCVRIGQDAAHENHYHWAIQRKDGGWELDAFWSPELWTTHRYREERLRA